MSILTSGRKPARRATTRLFTRHKSKVGPFAADVAPEPYMTSQERFDSHMRRLFIQLARVNPAGNVRIDSRSKKLIIANAPALVDFKEHVSFHEEGGVNSVVTIDNGELNYFLVTSPLFCSLKLSYEIDPLATFNGINVAAGNLSSL
jgi:hypothetical protein